MIKTPQRMTMALACFIFVTACSSAQAGAEAAVRASLKDPDSAKFGAFYFNKTTKKGCLTVNVKNSMGGYTGEQQAYVQQTDEGWQVYGIGELSPESCKEVHADQAES